MKKINLLFIFASFIINTQLVLAQTAKLLPIGDTVVYSGADCGRIKYKWLAGQINSKGAFISYADQVKSVNAKIKKTKSKSTLASLNKQKNGINKKIKSKQPFCDQLDTAIVPPSTSQSANSDSTTITWTQGLGDDQAYKVGSEHKFFCPPSGSLNSIWGTFYYSSDSSVCSAAVHAGLITTKNGGNVTVRMSEGRKAYIPSLRSNIKSGSYPSWTKTFGFVNTTTNQIVQTAGPIVIAWDMSIGNLRGSEETSFTLLCPIRGTKASVWGTNTYTDDSSICTAGVHAGKIKFNRGGVVTVTKSAGQSSYTGSIRNGVTTSSYGTWGGSFGF